MKKYFLFFTLLLTACNSYVPVTGNIEGKNEHFEKFSGTVIKSPPRIGSLSVRSESGTICTGNIKYNDKKSGSGKFNCTDGRSGTYTFSLIGNEGHGIGKTTDGANVEFFFHEPEK